jgi:hypothetical protein
VQQDQFSITNHQTVSDLFKFRLNVCYYNVYPNPLAIKDMCTCR